MAGGGGAIAADRFLAPRRQGAVARDRGVAVMIQGNDRSTVLPE